MTAEATARSRRSKRLGVAAELRAAAIYGTDRYLANTGGPVDLIEVAGLHVQVKAGATLTLSTIIDGLDSARAAAAGTNGIGACHVEYHREGRRIHRKLIVFDSEELAAWWGLPKENEE